MVVVDEAGGSLRSWPAPSYIRHNPIPADADRAQAVAVGEMLAGLISDCETKLAALTNPLDTARPASIRLIEAQVRELQNELSYLNAMDRRLVRRFRDANS